MTMIVGRRKRTISRRFLVAGVAMSELALRLTLSMSSVQSFDQEQTLLTCAETTLGADWKRPFEITRIQSLGLPDVSTQDY